MDPKHVNLVKIMATLLLLCSTSLGSTKQGAFTRCPTLVTYDAERRNTMCCYPCSYQDSNYMELPSTPEGAVSCPALPETSSFESVLDDHACSLKGSSASPPKISNYNGFPFDKEGNLVEGLRNVEKSEVLYHDIELGHGPKRVSSNIHEVTFWHSLYDKYHKLIQTDEYDDSPTVVRLCKEWSGGGSGVKEGIKGMQEGGKRWIVVPLGNAKPGEYDVHHVRLVKVRDSKTCGWRSAFTGEK